MIYPLFEHDLFGKPVSTFPDHRSEEHVGEDDDFAISTDLIAAENAPERLRLEEDYAARRMRSAAGASTRGLRVKAVMDSASQYPLGRRPGGSGLRASRRGETAQSVRQARRLRHINQLVRATAKISPHFNGREGDYAVPARDSRRAGRSASTL